MSEPISVSILDREFLVACTPEERPGLVAAASLVDGKMRELRASARTASADRIAVMAALNLAHELLQLRTQSEQRDQTLNRTLGELNRKLDGLFDAPR